MHPESGDPRDKSLIRLSLRSELEVALAAPRGPLQELTTPALVVDSKALEDNIYRMAKFGRQAGIAVRPHAKTHKSAEIAVRQLRAGAVGIATATAAEAIAFAASGIKDVLITSPLICEQKLAMAASLNRTIRLALVVDHAHQVDVLLRQLQPDDPACALFIDCDVGQGRTGIVHRDQALALAQKIASEPQLTFSGLQGFAGHAQHLADPLERKAASTAAAERLKDISGYLSDNGLHPRSITGSGTGTYAEDVAYPFTEIQVGSYAFMDSDYARILDDAGAPPPFAPSLFVLATVVSTNRRGQVTVDAGTKALAVNGPPPCIILGMTPGAEYRFAGDEHGIITIPDGAPMAELGAKLLIGATHCDPTVNLHSRIHFLTETGLEGYPIIGRY